MNPHRADAAITRPASGAARCELLITAPAAPVTVDKYSLVFVIATLMVRSHQVPLMPTLYRHLASVSTCRLSSSCRTASVLSWRTCETNAELDYISCCDAVSVTILGPPLGWRSLEGAGIRLCHVRRSGNGIWTASFTQVPQAVFHVWIFRAVCRRCLSCDGLYRETLSAVSCVTHHVITVSRYFQRPTHPDQSDLT